MGQRTGFRKVVLVFIVVLFLLFITPLVIVKVQLWVFRYRAEHLVRAVRAFQIRGATFAEMRALFLSKGWVNPGCFERSCYMSATVVLNPLGVRSWGWAHQNWVRLLGLYGARAAVVDIEVSVTNGIVERNAIEVKLQNAPTFNGLGDLSNDVLSGGVFSVPKFYIGSDWRGLALHPHYVLGGGHMRTMHLYHPDIYISFDAHADPAVIDRLATFDFSCFTRWMPCRRPGDLMPAAGTQYESEYSSLLRAKAEHVCSPTITGLMARDSSYAGVVKMKEMSQNSVYLEGQISVPSVQLEENFRPEEKLKPDSYWKNGEWRNLEVYDVNTDRVVAALPPEVHKGNRFIILGDVGRGYRSVRAEVCGIMPLNAENLAMVRKAIAEDLPSTQQPTPQARAK